MVDAVREQICARVKTRLQGIAGFTVLRNPKRRPMVAQLPMLAQFDGGQDPLDQFTGAQQWRLALEIDIYDATDDDGQATNEAYAKLVAAVIPPLGGGVYDVTLGGLAVHVREDGVDDPETLADEGRATYRAMAVRFLIDFWTAENDPRTLGPA